MLRRLAIAAVALSAMIGQPAWAARPAPRPIPAQRLPIDFGIGLNNLGQVLGPTGVWQHGVVTDIRGPDGGQGFPVAINDRGQVIGQSTTADGHEHGFIWQHGVATDLGTLGGADSRALAVNDRGDVVGVSNTADGPDAFFVWRDGVLTRLPVPGQVDMVYAVARINNNGEVLGNYFSGEPPSSPLRVFLWNRGRLTDLGAVGGHDVTVNDLNDRGQFVATDNRPDRQPLVFLWDRGRRTDVGVLSFPSTTGSVDLNNRGQVVFTGTKPNGHDQAYLWQRGVSTSLGDLGGPYPQSTAYAVNERGEVTGTINGAAGARAYRWRSGVFTLLDVLPGDDGSESFGINDRGLVMGLSAAEMDGIHTVIWR